MILGYVCVETKINDGKQIISSAGHFNCHGSALVQYKAHRPMWKPLDAATGPLLTLYCPGSRQGRNQQNSNAKYTYFTGHFDGHRDAAV
jgi:hypothetical protein